MNPTPNQIFEGGTKNTKGSDIHTLKLHELRG